MNIIHRILSIVPSCREFKGESQYTALKIAVIIPIMISAQACTSFGNHMDSALSYYQEHSPFKLSEYNYATNEPVSMSLTDFKDYKFKVSTDSFYVKRKFTLSNSLIDQGKAFHESEERRSKERYLVLR